MRLLTTIKSTAFALTIASISAAFAADEVKVHEVKDFSRVGEVAAEKRVPIVLMFSAGHCTYCHRVENEFLRPMLMSGDYEDKALIRKVKIDQYSKTLRDFSGEKISPAEFAERYDIKVTPTVVFINGDGMELAKKRVGLTTPDFYGGYLDKSINQALDILRRDSPMRIKLSAVR
ncbi:MAG: thioredoxin family protein [Pseudomonadota bacterium]